MTTQDRIRRAVTRDGASARRSRTAQAAVEAVPSLPERLYAAREQKGVDLYRAERDTKIRARYLSALERGDYRELPGAVYTKGFLRNYALYLGLDPDEILLQWRRERGEIKEGDTLKAVPRPIAAPRRALTFSPSLIVFALLLLAVTAFAVYLGIQLLRFAKPPTIAVTEPASAVIDVAEDTTSYVLEGTSIPGGSVTVKVADQELRTTADSSGDWSLQVDLRRGKNQFEITATDPATGKVADQPVQRVINVPFLVIAAPTLTLEAPAEGSAFENGAIPVKGSTSNAKTVVVSAQYAGPAAGQAVASAAPGASPPAVAPIDAVVADDGTFQAPLELSAGRWTIVVTATSAEGKATSLQRAVTIQFKGVNMIIAIKASRAWLKVWVDGKVSEVTGDVGRVYAPGKQLTFTGEEKIEVRTGKASATYFTVNGVSLGRLSDEPNPQTWLFAPPNPPERTDRR